jgi:hypothetical protein
MFLSAAGFTLGFAAIVIARLRAAVMERRIRWLLMARVHSRPHSSALDHSIYITASHGLAVVIGDAYAVSAFLRMGRARRRFAAIDPREAGR